MACHLMRMLIMSLALGMSLELIVMSAYEIVANIKQWAVGCEKATVKK